MTRVEISRRYRERHPERARAQTKRYREGAEGYARTRATQKAYRRAHPEYTFAYKHGMTVAEAREVLLTKPDTCDICGQADTPEKPICFDHCHATGSHRGWLCRHCNTALGLLGDDVERLTAAIAYLHGGRP